MATHIRHSPPESPIIIPDPALTVAWCHQICAHAPHLWGADIAGRGFNVTRDDLAELDDNFPLMICGGLTSNLPLHPVIDPKPHLITPICEICGTWSCDDCIYRRLQANRNPRIEQTCPRCGSGRGRFYATRHRTPMEHENLWESWEH